MKGPLRLVGLVGKGNRPGGEFGKRLRDRFLARNPDEPKYRLQSFFTFQGTIAKAQCITPGCETYIHERAYWIGHRGPLCYSCYLRGDKK